MNHPKRTKSSFKTNSENKNNKKVSFGNKNKKTTSPTTPTELDKPIEIPSDEKQNRRTSDPNESIIEKASHSHEKFKPPEPKIISNVENKEISKSDAKPDDLNNQHVKDNSKEGNSWWAWTKKNVFAIKPKGDSIKDDLQHTTHETTNTEKTSEETALSKNHDLIAVHDNPPNENKILVKDKQNDTTHDTSEQHRKKSGSENADGVGTVEEATESELSTMIANFPDENDIPRNLWKWNKTVVDTSISEDNSQKDGSRSPTKSIEISPRRISGQLILNSILENPEKKVQFKDFGAVNRAARHSLDLDSQEDIRWILEQNPYWNDVDDDITADHERNLVIRHYKRRIEKRNKDRGKKNWKSSKKDSDINIPGQEGHTFNRKQKRVVGAARMHPVMNDVYVNPWDEIAWGLERNHWISPVTSIIEAVNELFKPFIRKVRNALDVVSIPYSYNGEVISRIKGCMWVMSRTSRILLKPSTVNPRHQEAVKHIINKSFNTFEHSIFTLLVECRSTLEELVKHRKLFKYYKRKFKRFDLDMFLWLVDEDEIADTLHYSTPYYASNRVPVDPMIWESFPTWEKVPEVALDVNEKDVPEPGSNAGFRYYQLLIEKPSYDFLWFPNEECYIKERQDDEWYNYNKLDNDIRLEVMSMVHKSARDILMVSKRTFFEANHMIKKRPHIDDPERATVEGSIVNGLWEVMARQIGTLPRVKTHRTEYLRIHRLQMAMQSFFGILDNIEHLIILLSYLIRWLKKHYLLVKPLAYCLTDEEARTVLRREYYCVGYLFQVKINFFCKKLKFQRVRFPMTNEECDEYESFLRPEWKDHEAATAKLQNIIICCGGVFIRGQPFKKKRIEQPFIWAWKYAWQIPPKPPKPATIPIINDVTREDRLDDEAPSEIAVSHE